MRSYGQKKYDTLISWKLDSVELHDGPTFSRKLLDLERMVNF